MILHEQFDRLQEADRFYYLDRVGDSDFYEALKELEFSDIVKRNTGLTDLPKDIFTAADEPSDDASPGESEGEGDGETDGSGSGSGSGDPVTDDDCGSGDDDESEDTSEDDDDDDTVTPPPPPTGSGTGTGTGAGTGTGTGTGTATSPFVVYLGAAVASDTVLGAATGDVLSGGDGDDNVLAYGDDDTVFGGNGDDYVDGGDGNDAIFGGAGADYLKGGAGNDELDGGAGDDRIDGGAGVDTVTAGAGRDVIKTGQGNDTIVALDNDGNDVIDAGDELGDSDTLDMSAIQGRITVYLSANGTGTATITNGDVDTIKGIENFKGGQGDDVIVASTDDNVLEGGAGADTFVFTSAAAANGDIISDFQDGDRVDLSTIFSSLSLGNETFQPTLVSGSFTNAGEFRFRAEDGNTVVEGDVDGDLNADFAITIIGQHELQQKDFA